MIVERTQSRGLSVDRPGGEETALKPLAKSTIARRRRDRLSSLTSPERSNLTWTGKLLKAIRYKFFERRIEFSIAGGENQKKAKYVSEDRPFLNLSGQQVKDLMDLYVKKLKHFMR